MVNGNKMSKSLKRVKTALRAAGFIDTVVETGTARTAANAAEALGCEIDQIAKSIIFAGLQTQQAILFVTAGSNLVNKEKATKLAKEPLGKADAAFIREQTGFAIGGVSPVGHLNTVKAFMDPRLFEFDKIWAAAGTPNHVFSICPTKLQLLCGADIRLFTDTEKM
jgi:prolyl-tRNA editing enzyme YbaK/EbsC (Cys-tRNA(Pro) deacylase)